MRIADGEFIAERRAKKLRRGREEKIGRETRGTTHRETAAEQMMKKKTKGANNELRRGSCGIIETARDIGRKCECAVNKISEQIQSIRFGSCSYSSFRLTDINLIQWVTRCLIY